MPLEIRLPKLTDSMAAGSVIAWRKQPGDAVRAGDVIAEVEADKTTVDIEAPIDGILGPIEVAAGSGPVAVGTLLTVILDKAAVLANGHGAEVASVATNGVEKAGPQQLTHLEVPPRSASPLARKVAERAQVDIAELEGSGPNGRVMMADVLAVLGVEADTERPTTTSPASAPIPMESSTIEIPHSSARVVIARRLGKSKQTIPHFYLSTTCRVDALNAARADLNATVDAGSKFTLNDFIVRATALALRTVPEVNASWSETAVRRHGRVDLNVAVATESALIAPVVRDAASKGLAQLSAEIRDLARRARAGRLRPEEYDGGTFTVTNLGMYGLDEFFAIINPPQAAILAVGSASERPVVNAGVVGVATVMNCSLSADHRVFDGAAGARFLAAFKGYIERPVTMLV